MSDTLDREATTVRVGRTGMLEMEDEAEQSRLGREGTQLVTIAEIPPFPFLGTYRWMCGLVGAEVVGIFGHRKKTERKRDEFVNNNRKKSVRC